MKSALAGTSILLGLLISSPNALALDLTGYLGRVTEKHRGLEALRQNTRAAEEVRISGDLELLPKFEMKAGYLSDKRQPGMLGATESRNESYSASLSKLFSSGTMLSLKMQTVGYETIGLSPTLLAQLRQSARYAQGGIGFTVSQSLWKNAFGHSTDLRRERESIVAASDTANFDLQSRTILSQAESVFWDYIYLVEEVKIREASLERAKRLEAWFQRRQADGIADRADLLNAQSLVASRELQVVSSKDALVASEKKVRDFLELNSSEDMPSLEGNISDGRDLRALISGEGNIFLLDAYRKNLMAKSSDVAARETDDKNSADLVLSGSYMTNSFEQNEDAFGGTQSWTRTDTPTTQVGINWVYTFDGDAKESSSAAARAKAHAAQLDYERALRESTTAWEEMLRRHNELSQQIKAAESLQRIQAELAAALKDKYARGRAITSEIITSEQNAAESELNLTKLRAEQRKLEAQTRLYIAIKE